MGTFFCYHCPMNYEAVIGLEIHAELNTKTKMFCFSPNDPDEQHPNINICPICMGHPGTLPFINEDAVKKVIAVGLALSGTITRNPAQRARREPIPAGVPVAITSPGSKVITAVR